MKVVSVPERDESIDAHRNETVNSQVSMRIYDAGRAVFCVILASVVFLVIVSALTAIFAIITALKATNVNFTPT